MIIYGLEVRGVEVDDASRCLHYRSDKDIVAIQFYCCKHWFSCIECHDALADHQVETWPLEVQDSPAILCGKCGTRMSIRKYLASHDQCPACNAEFNPGCRLHHHLYFEKAS